MTIAAADLRQDDTVQPTSDRILTYRTVPKPLPVRSPKPKVCDTTKLWI